MHWLKQPISGQHIILVVEQPMDWSGVTNTLIKTTNIVSTNSIGRRATNDSGQR